jgi:hypothetical protein
VAFRQLLPAEVSHNRVVRAVSGSAFRYEITTLEELRSVFFQKPLDRTRARLVRTDVDIADALGHLRIVVSSAGSEQFLAIVRGERDF